jgi:ElaB/YqjD/DUF883 family membrane-anchored ribosome-binding protein
MRAGNTATAREIAEIGRLLRDLQERVTHLGPAAKADMSEGSRVLPEMISEALAELAGGIRENARHFGSGAARVGSDALGRVEEEVGHRPFATIAVALGIGFLLGMLNRR